MIARAEVVGEPGRLAEQPDPDVGLHGDRVGHEDRVAPRRLRGAGGLEDQGVLAGAHRLHRKPDQLAVVGPWSIPGNQLAVCEATLKAVRTLG
jgi:hypothetical protein